MPTAITHALVGASMSILRERSVSPIKLLLIASALAVMPDIDVLGYRSGIPYSDMLGHRGLTHSLPFAAGIALLVALVAFPEVPRFSKHYWYLALLLFVATASHGILDAFTDAGLGVGFFIPFDETRYFAPWRPLTTSPLSVMSFFSKSGGAILINELKWIGIPIVVFVMVSILVRRMLRKDGP